MLNLQFSSTHSLHLMSQYPESGDVARMFRICSLISRRSQFFGSCENITMSTLRHVDVDASTGSSYCASLTNVCSPAAREKPSFKVQGIPRSGSGVGVTLVMSSLQFANGLCWSRFSTFK